MKRLMKRLRRLFNLTALSLVLHLLVLLAWWGSSRMSVGSMVWRTDEHVCAFAVFYGQLAWLDLRYPPGPRAYTETTRSMFGPPLELSSMARALTNNTGARYVDSLGFTFATGRLDAAAGVSTAAGVPLWGLALLTAVAPLLWLARIPTRRRLLRRQSGHCTACGYDLRASPGACPECGAPPAAPVRPPALEATP